MTATALSFSKKTVFVDAPPTGADGGKLVKFAPLIAGSAPVKFAAGKLANDAPEPLNSVAVIIPAFPIFILLPMSIAELKV